MWRKLRLWITWIFFGFIALSIAVVSALRWIDPPTSAFMIASRIAAGEDNYRLRYRWTDYPRISPHAPLAMIAAEDQMFAVHWGFDFKSIDSSIRKRRNGKRLRGASTISQQVAKNLFLWKSPSFVRKGLEAYFTVLIETLWPKKRILEVYLNIAEFGRGVYGVEAAGRHFFRKPAARLTATDSALLAAVLPNPRRLKVNAPSRYVRARQQWILRQMQSLNGRSYLAQISS